MFYDQLLDGGFGLITTLGHSYSIRADWLPDISVELGRKKAEQQRKGQPRVFVEAPESVSFHPVRKVEHCPHIRREHRKNRNLRLHRAFRETGAIFLRNER